MLSYISYISPNASELLEMAGAVRRRRGQPPASTSDVPELTGPEEGPRALLRRLLPSLQTLLEVRPKVFQGLGLRNSCWQ